MKKTISITIAGVVFHIEEDGYDRLQGYLESIKRYFSAYEGSAEIIEDIEARIAEKFYDKVKKEEKQAITSEDVDQLIQSMGTVADFEAIEEEEDFGASKSAYTQTSAENQQTYAHAEAGSTFTSEQQAFPPAQKRLYRDTKRKVLGGVCAGIAHYLNFDPLWVRLATLFLFIGLPIFGGWSHTGDFFGPLSGIVFIVYIACWVSFPGNANLEEDEKLRKLYRDPERKALGGVAAGVAAYTGWDLAIIRFVWVISILFFGTGLILYLVLWIITPTAKTLTDRMKMQGEPITLNNIETNIKRTLNVENQTVESTVTKVLLFPFRALAAIFEGLGPFFRFLLVLARIVVGLILLGCGMACVICLLIALGAAIGLSGWEDVPITVGMPIKFIRDASPWMFVLTFLAAVVPALAMGLAGLSLLTKQNYFKPLVWQTLLGLFLVGSIGSGIMIPQYISNFARRGVVEKTRFIDGDKTPVFDIDEQVDDEFDDLYSSQVTLEGYEGTEIKLVEEFSSRGRTTKEARERAAQLKHQITQKDSLVTIAKNFEAPDDIPFRKPELNIKVFIPYEKEFSMTESFARYVTNRFPNEMFNENMFAGSIWKYTRDGELICLNRSVPQEEDTYMSDDDSDHSYESSIGRGVPQEYNLEGFTNLDISGGYAVEVKRGSAFKVTVYAENERKLDDVSVKVSGNTLVIKRKNILGFSFKSSRESIRIEMPALEEVEFVGAISATVKGFDQVKKIELAGASKSTFSGLNAEQVDVNVHGAARLTLLGSAQQLKADISGASRLEAFALKANDVQVDASGASKAHVTANTNLNATASGASQINYKGNAKVEESHSGGSSINHEEEMQE
ncbi:hypothetical protein BWI96_08850 [Siphonobacter sp. SORGH_AS_0500]|uniref:PspC domain-containing protein n=1 Tax=Siphonobacter sp. SORGH_AS_0500 TaxID=1864824 RepID=UPI000CB3F372|nr:DUF2807 domain-containing protein [Siphonobacter sp. SORGH_AS_0500]PKK36979.1 hypothetical protein BWI96_08850 [Siphonobacter sp. SORGH_AS_0500]